MLKVRQKLGKYRIEGRIAQGGFADVYRAYDTIEGIQVALKVPKGQYVTTAVLDDFRREVRLTAGLEHPGVLGVKNAGFIDEHFVIVYALGERTLADRLARRLSTRTALEIGEQLLEALAYAHANRIIHCDVKPENLVLFPGGRLRLADFGISKVAQRTLRASGSGTVGYVAPEQALGKPSFRSDVFSAGLILYRMLTGHLPEWPYEWPPPGYARVRGKLHPDLIEFLRRSLEVDHRRRYRDAGQMLAAFQRIRPKILERNGSRPAGRRTPVARDWRTVRHGQFRREHGRALEARYQCERCTGPVSESMAACPWCGAKRATHRMETRFPAQCPRCRRGVKLDWRFCPWCYGPEVGPLATRSFSDRRYEARCDSSTCSDRRLMRFMRYCPWCRRKVRRKWALDGSRERCPRCRWGVLRDFWDHCPWCAKALRKR